MILATGLASAGITRAMLVVLLLRLLAMVTVMTRFLRTCGGAADMQFGKYGIEMQMQCHAALDALALSVLRRVGLSFLAPTLSCESEASGLRRLQAPRSRSPSSGEDMTQR